jgi:hypothetical protein
LKIWECEMTIYSGVMIRKQYFEIEV